jgi:glycosyltransferase involved in cell wall biosynthesis
MLLSICIPTVPPRENYLNRLLSEIQKQIIKYDLYDKVEILIFKDNFESSVGSKRNRLIEESSGKFCVIIDDDDMISNDYCKLITDEIIKNPKVDQISHNHRYYHNNNHKFLTINVSNKNDGESIIFLNFIRCKIKKYYDDRNENWELRMNINQLLNNLEVKEVTLIKSKNKSFKMLYILLIIILLQKFVTKNLRYTCHTTPIRKEIFQSIKFTDRPREQDLEWATKVYQLDLIKTESHIDKDLYYYFYNKKMSINRGQWGNMSEEELKEKMNEVKSNTIQLFHEFNKSENVKIKWIN